MNVESARRANLKVASSGGGMDKLPSQWIRFLEVADLQGLTDRKFDSAWAVGWARGAGGFEYFYRLAELSGQGDRADLVDDLRDW